MTFGNHVLLCRQTDPQTPRLGSARRAPLLQFKRCMGIAVLPTGLILTRCVLPASVMTARTSGTPMFMGECPGRQRRCGTQVVSPILGDVLTNSRWWFTCHRQNLCNKKDHLQQFTSSALLDRGDERKGENFMDFSSIHLVRQQFPKTSCFLFLPEDD